MKSVVLLSGGMDSVALAHILKGNGDKLYCLSVNYGQKHSKELKFANMCAQRLFSEWRVVDMEPLRELLSTSALTSDKEVPHGHYTEESMKATVVPNRNMILLSIAVGWAVALGADRVVTAVHAGDHAIYPDCRPAFIDEFNRTARIGNSGFYRDDFRVTAPFIHNTKAEIAKRGQEAKVPWDLTWSCYEGGSQHCGLCATCVERREAFHLAGIKDPTLYQVSLERSLAVGGINL
jgi:7-cyano-7-deazaguanine synthase